MQLKHEFVVDAPLERAWRLLDQLDKVVPCMPGASYLGQDGDSIRVGMKVGPVFVDVPGTDQTLLHFAPAKP